MVLDRLLKIKEKHDKILSDLTMDVLKALVCPNMDIRQKILDFVMDLLSPKNIHEVCFCTMVPSSCSLLPNPCSKSQSSDNFFDRYGNTGPMMTNC